MLKSLFGSAPHRAVAAAAGQFAYPLKLNLGCGYRKMDGYLNVDRSGDSQPDLVLDLEKLPWPFPDNSVTHISMSHVLEHIGQEADKFLQLIQEMYRVCAPQAELTVAVPHPRHDNFLSDPTHVRPILPTTLQLFDQAMNREAIATGNGASPLGLQLGVDFEIRSVQFILDPRWAGRFEAGELTSEQVFEYAQSQNNVIAELTLVLMAHKPGRG
jgi:SAM-dependent methyltransferase